VDRPAAKGKKTKGGLTVCQEKRIARRPTQETIIKGFRVFFHRRVSTKKKYMQKGKNHGRGGGKCHVWILTG